MAMGQEDVRDAWRVMVGRAGQQPTTHTKGKIGPFATVNTPRRPQNNCLGRVGNRISAFFNMFLRCFSSPSSPPDLGDLSSDDDEEEEDENNPDDDEFNFARHFVRKREGLGYEDYKGFAGVVTSSEKPLIQTVEKCTNAKVKKVMSLKKGGYGSVNKVTLKTVNEEEDIVAVKEISFGKYVCNEMEQCKRWRKDEVRPLRIDFEARFREIFREVRILKQLRHTNICLYLFYGIGGDLGKEFKEFLKNTDRDCPFLDEALVAAINDYSSGVVTTFKQHVHKKYFNTFLFIGMEQMKCSLRGRLDKMGKQGKIMTKANVNDVMEQLLTALAYVHENKIVHRDIKPGNILLKRINGKTIVKLGDFGLARSLVKGVEYDSNCISLVGTPTYYSPEDTGFDKYIPKEHVQKTDIFSLGLVYFQLENWIIDSKEFSPKANEIREGQLVTDNELMRSMLKVNYVERPSSATCLEELKRLMQN